MRAFWILGLGLAIASCKKEGSEVGEHAEPGMHQASGGVAETDDPAPKAAPGSGQSAGVAEPEDPAAQGAAPSVNPADLPPPAMKPGSNEAPPPTPPEPAGLYGPGEHGADGRSVYTKSCAMCHGADGTGQQMRTMMPKIGDLTSAEVHGKLDDAALKELIKKGRGQMPPFQAALTEDQINLVIGYVRTLKK
jgi:mono/diheme cytochrome c family protein